MKIAVLGRGKTGSKVIEVCQEKGLSTTVFSTENPVTQEKLQGHDVAISFLPGEAFLKAAPELIKAKLPVVSGSTGLTYPEELLKQITEAQLSWIQGHNFSLGMNLIHAMIKNLSRANRLFEDMDLKIHEVHHTKKLDAPSGTALKWGEWVNLPHEITSERTGDVVGDHILSLQTETEKITLRHEALDRKIFAAGAVWAAEYLTKKSLSPGLHWFEALAQEELL